MRTLMHPRQLAHVSIEARVQLIAGGAIRSSCAMSSRARTVRAARGLIPHHRWTDCLVSNVVHEQLSHKFETAEKEFPDEIPS